MTWCHIEQKIKPGNWLLGHITPQAMGKDMFDTFMAHPGVIPGLGGTLQPTVQILSRFSQEQILVRRKSQELFQNLRSSWKKLLATLKVSGALCSLLSKSPDLL